MTVELTQKVEAALNGLETFKTELLAKTAKFDAFDQTKFDNIQKSIGDAIEEGQAFKAKQKATEDELNALKTAFNRAPSASTGANEEKELAKKRKEAFNRFAKSGDTKSKQYFDEFVKEDVKDELEKKALSVGSNPDGGYLVMPEMGGIINTRVYESSPMRQLATVTAVATDTYEYILDNGEADGEWVGELQAPTTETTPQLGKLAITVHELAAKPKASQKMIDDGIIDVEGWLSGKVADVFARKEATAFVSGNGVNKPRGILSYTAGTTLASQEIEQVVSGSAAAFTYDGLVNLQNSLKEPYQANASFLIRRATNASLMTIKDGEGRPIFNMTFDKNVGVQPTLMGQPVYFGADIPAVAANALAMVYGDIRRAYQIVDRIGLRVLRDPYTDKPNVIFYTTKRVGGAVVNFEAAKIQKLAAS
jgi:HK97 family phage major capsid protein